MFVDLLGKFCEIVIYLLFSNAPGTSIECGSYSWTYIYAAAVDPSSRKRRELRTALVTVGLGMPDEVVVWGVSYGVSDSGCYVKLVALEYSSVSFMSVLYGMVAEGGYWARHQESQLNVLVFIVHHWQTLTTWLWPPLLYLVLFRLELTAVGH